MFDFSAHLDTSALDTLANTATTLAAEVVTTAADDLVGDIRANWSGYYPPASAPGEPPAIRSGTLDSSVQTVKETGHAAGSVSARVSITAAYAGDVEYGTSRMAARPFFRPAAYRAAQTFRARFAQLFTGLANRGGA